MSGRYQQDRATAALWQAKLNALQQALGSNNFFHGTDFRNFLTNGDWQNYQYLTSRAPDPFGVSGTNRYLSANLPEYHLIDRIRNAQDLDEVNRQLSLWKQYDPLNAPANVRNYIRMQSVGSVGTRPQFNINEPVPIRGKTGDGAPSTFTYGPGQGYVPNPPVSSVGTSAPTFDSESSPEHFGDGSFGAPTYGPGQGYTPKSAKVAVDTSKPQKSGTISAKSGNIGTSSTKVIGGSGRSTGGTYSTPKPTPMYNPDNVSLSYSLSNTPISPEMQRQALIDKWNQEHGRTGSTGYATGKGMLTSSSDGTYATGEGIKDANGNVLTNPGGDWEYQYALKNPQYGLGMMGKMSDAQKNYLQAVSDNMGYKYNFTGANRFV